MSALSPQTAPKVHLEIAAYCQCSNAISTPVLMHFLFPYFSFLYYLLSIFNKKFSFLFFSVSIPLRNDSPLLVLRLQGGGNEGKGEKTFFLLFA